MTRPGFLESGLFKSERKSQGGKFSQRPRHCFPAELGCDPVVSCVWIASQGLLCSGNVGEGGGGWLGVAGEGGEWVVVVVAAVGGGGANCWEFFLSS